MKINTLRISGVLIIAALLFGCTTISLVNSVRDGKRGANNLDRTQDVATANIGGQTYLFVAAWDDDAVSVFGVADNGRLSFVDDVRDGERGADNLNGAEDVATAVIGGQTYLFVAADFSSAVSVFSVADDGRLTFVDDVSAGYRGANNLFGVQDVATAVIGGQGYLFVSAGYNSDDVNFKAVSVFSVADDGRLTFVDDIVAAIADEEDGVAHIELVTAVIGNQTYLFEIDSKDDAVNVFSVADDGRLTFVDYVSDGERGVYNLESPQDVATADIGDETYLFVAAGERAVSEGAVSVFSVADDGRLTFVDDYGERDEKLESARGVATSVIGGQTYLFVNTEDAVIVFSVADDGRLSLVYDYDDPSTYGFLIEIETAVIGGHTYLFSSRWKYDYYLVSAFKVNIGNFSN